MVKNVINCLVVGSSFQSQSKLEEYFNSIKQYKTSIRFLLYSDSFSPNDTNKYQLTIFLIENEEDAGQAKNFFSKFLVPKPAICILKNEDYKAAFELTKAGADDCLIENEISLVTLKKLLKNAELLLTSNSLNPTALQVITNFVSNIKLGIAIFNVAGMMIDCNDLFRKTFDTDKKTLLKSPLRKLCEPLTVEESAKFDALIKGEIQLLEFNKQLISKKDEVEWVKMSLSFVPGDSLLPSIYLMRMVNITSDVKTKLQLEQEKYLLQTLLDNIPDAIYFKDYAHRYIKVSKHAELIGIRNPETAIGKSDFDLSYTPQAKTAFNDEEFIIRTGYTIINKVERNCKQDGKETWISTTKAPLYDTRGNITGIVGITRDITDLKQKEETLKNLITQLKESNTTKDRFFSFISHDLRAPFSSLLGFSELALEDFPNLQPEDLRKYLENINSSAKNVFALLNNLLQFSRFQTGRYSYTPELLNLRSLILSGTGLIKGNAEMKEITITNDVPDDLYVYVDEEMIKSVIQNLITNSIKFTPRGGRIFISIIDRNEKEITILFEDNGIGMTKEVLNNLFKIDVIHTTPGTEKEHGTGLGLLIIKESIEKNKGQIKVESTPGEGSRFIITLPTDTE